MEIIKYLIENKININVINDNELKLIYENGNLNIIQYLLKDINYKNLIKDNELIISLLNSKIINDIINMNKIKEDINYYLNSITNEENKIYFKSYYYYKLNKSLTNEFKKELNYKVNLLNY